MAVKMPNTGTPKAATWNDTVVLTPTMVDGTEGDAIFTVATGNTPA